MLDPLEPRRLLSSSLSAATGLLTISGGAAADTIVVTNDGTNLTITGIKGQSQFSLASVHGLILKGGGKNDTLDASAAGMRATLLGGDGNDTLIGSSANDFLDGQGGNDLLQGGLSAD